MINSREQLVLALLDMPETQRLERHAELEIAFSSERDKTEMLTKALKQSQLECARLRSELNNIIEEHKQDECDIKAELEFRSYIRDCDNDMRAE